MNKTQLRQRQILNDNCLPASLPPLLSRLYRARGVTDARQLERSARNLHDYCSLNAINSAVLLLENALQQNKPIVVIGDFDSDGATSTALMVLALRSMGYQHVDYLIPNRFDDGYGLSPAVVSRAANKGAELIITVDNGISSISGVKAAQDFGIQVLITDHHLPGEILPDAEVIINPNLADCTFPSKALAGVGVAFYLMLALRSHLRQGAWFTKQQIVEPNLAKWLDLVALGTVADVVPLDSNNRILVYQGLNRIRAGHCRPGILALLEVADRDPSRLKAGDLGFVLGPRLNAAGRLDNMSIGVELLLGEDLFRVRILANELHQLNQTRREIEQEMNAEALQLCDELEQNSKQLPYGIAIYQAHWHQGVVGIVAARIKDRFHRPVIAFAPAAGSTIKGSGRSISGLHLRDALSQMDVLYPGLILSFGGHAMAAGLVLAESKFEQFQQCFAALMAQWLDEEQLNAIIWSDGELTSQQLSLETAQLIDDAGPWGHAFPEPIFDGHFRVLQQRLVAGRHLKLVLEPAAGGREIDGIAFNIDIGQWPNHDIKYAQLAYQLDINQFRGKQNLQLLVRHLWPE